MERTEGGVAMKDLKKIEEEYLRENDNEILHVYDRHAGFVDGYHKALENLWHSADDKPEKGKWILYVSAYRRYLTAQSPYYPISMKKWCYINDIENEDKERA